MLIESPRTKRPQARERRVLADRHRLHQAVALAVFRHEREAELDALGDRLALQHASAHLDRSALDRDATRERLEQLGAAGAHEAVQADDLTLADVEVEAAHGQSGGIRRIRDGDAAQAAGRHRRTCRAGRAPGRRSTCRPCSR